MKFTDLNLSEDIQSAVVAAGFEKPSPIQELTIPLALEGKDVIGQAQTGTGKTAAFGLPTLDKIRTEENTIQALVIAPTRELAVQSQEELFRFGRDKGVKVRSVYGGSSIEKQIKALRSGAHIVVGTPGRLLDLIKRKALKLNNIETLILDEADEMLNMGFLEDIELILEETNDEKKMLFFSATMPKAIMDIAKKFMDDYKLLKVKKQELTTDLTEQIYYEVKQEDKFEALCRVLDYTQDFYGIVFCRTKSEVDDVTNRLKARNYDAECIHGDITQGLRQKALDLFKKKVLTILVATDVAARGIDVSNLTHVINYAIPQEAESYVHRIGRTGRAGHKGIAITFVTPREARTLAQIKRVTKTDIKRESIPNVSEIIEAKKEALIAYIDEIIKEEDYTSYESFADKLLEERDARQVVSSILRHFYEDEFLPESYGEIQDVKVKIEDKTRLFIALGSKDGYNPGRLLDLLNKKAKTPGRKVKDIKIMDKYSFITVPLQEAEFIMRALNSKKDSKPLVEKATGGVSGGGSSEGKKRGRRSEKDSKKKKSGEKEKSSRRSKKSDDKKASSKSKEKKSKDKSKKSDKSSGRSKKK